MLQLILFIDDRPNIREFVKEVELFLQQNSEPSKFSLQVINVSRQPYLAEHFKVVMTPALIKVNPLPRQVIAGKNLLSQFADSWKDWQNLASNSGQSPTKPSSKSDNHPENYQDLRDDSNPVFSDELIRLADEVFKLNQQNTLLEEESRFKDRMIATLAHDLRNPLTAISLALETIEINGEQLSTAVALQLFKHARNQTKTLDAMITNILEASKGSTAKLKIYLEKIQISHLCKNVINDYSLVSRLDAKHQTLISDIPTDLPLVYIDAERVRQVLNNLIDNAIKYTPNEGEIRVAVLHRTSQKVEVTVTDNGIGVPNHLRDQIFEDRFRVLNNTDQIGYGIGLAVCRRIILAHYGQIWVDTPGKQGSCFHFTLPVY